MNGFEVRLSDPVYGNGDRPLFASTTQKYLLRDGVWAAKRGAAARLIEKKTIRE